MRDASYLSADGGVLMGARARALHSCARARGIRLRGQLVIQCKQISGVVSV